jgi:hypothetical protein
MATDDLIARLLDATDDAAGASVVDALCAASCSSRACAPPA